MQWRRFYGELNICSNRNLLGAYFMPGNVLGPRETEMKDFRGKQASSDNLVHALGQRWLWGHK